MALLAADGHLSLDIPSFFYQIGMDTSVFGAAGAATLRQKGLMIPGFPQLAVGTNGMVAWTQTQESGDITDWYREEVKLDAHGEPAQTLFKGEWKDVVAHEETFVVRDIPLLSSVGRTETWKRWTTFDGRWLADIEGRPATRDETLADGEALVSMQGDLVVPGDADHDGVVTALSFDYTGFDMGNLIRANHGWGTSRDVWEFLDNMRFVTTYSQNMAAADSHGNILYTGYQSVPCRGYLPRDEHGDWQDGANPNRVLDGTKYPAFTIPLAADGTVDEGPGQSDPTRCVVPFDRYPQSVTPDKGYVVNANNDPGALTFDQSLANDEQYIGGPWDLAFRADSIARSLEKAIADGTADVAKMAEIQANHDSRLAELFHDDLAAAIARAKTAASPTYSANAARIDEAIGRLAAWKARGYQAESGVETFYETPTATQREDAIATAIWSNWLPRVIQNVFDDEHIPGDLWNDGDGSGRVRLLHRMLSAPDGLASKVAATGESAYCDVLGTEAIERCDDLVLTALVAGLDWLSGAGDGEQGGFGTADQSQWLWGLRHQVKFGSLLANQIGQNELFDLFLADFRVTTDILPLADELAAGDPRKGLTWFPRHGDQWGVDAGNPGFSGQRYGYGSGPVMRMVVGFMPDGRVVGQNIIPGGQSGRPGSPFFADQAALWLGNKALPLRYSVDDMVAGAVGREVLTPTAGQR
ncbi:MAG: penicillin acylase family protein [Myxococcota bacterium]